MPPGAAVSLQVQILGTVDSPCEVGRYDWGLLRELRADVFYLDLWPCSRSIVSSRCPQRYTGPRGATWKQLLDSFVPIVFSDVE